MTTINTQAADMLDNAANWLEENHWTRFKLRNERTGGCCALGALRIANGGEAVGYHVYTPNGDAFSPYFAAVLAVEDTLATTSITHFNDSGTRDKRKVVRLFRRTARKLRAVAA